MHGVIFSVAANSWKASAISKGHTEAGVNPLPLNLKCSTKINLSQSQANHNLSVWTSGLSVYMFTYMFTHSPP